MQKTCFVIMGYGIKENLNLDCTYNEIIKPCIKKNNLIPYPIYTQNEYNAYRCDEISGSISIDYKFVTCLNGADIVIADISTMNVNAIYELGARHALKPRSTILLCSQDKEKEFKFLDITYVPIIFYEHNGTFLKENVIAETSKQLNKYIDFAVNSTTNVPDSPIYRALNEKSNYDASKAPNGTIYDLYKQGREKLDNSDYEDAEKILSELYSADSSEENLLLLSLAKYKIAEAKHSCKGLVDCFNFITENIDIEESTSEYLFGRLAAICLRIFNINKSNEYYYLALKYYNFGANFCKQNLYCPRNYCALLLRIFEVTDDPDIIKEYYYTAKHFAKLYVNMPVNVGKKGSYTDRIYYMQNKSDLNAIINDGYDDYNQISMRITEDNDITTRQRETILEGIKNLNEYISQIKAIVSKV